MDLPSLHQIVVDNLQAKNLFFPTLPRGRRYGIHFILQDGMTNDDAMEYMNSVIDEIEQNQNNIGFVTELCLSRSEDDPSVIILTFYNDLATVELTAPIV